MEDFVETGYTAEEEFMTLRDWIISAGERLKTALAIEEIEDATRELVKATRLFGERWQEERMLGSDCKFLATGKL